MRRLTTCFLMLLLACGDAQEEEAPAVPPATVPTETTPVPVLADDTGQADTVDPEAATEDTVPRASAEDEARGGDLLDRASRAYEGLRSLQADFVMTLENPLLRRTTTSEGTLYQRMPDRILLRFTRPEGDVIVGDGTYFWVYYPSINPEQVTRAPAAQAGSGGVDLRAQFVGNPRERFEWTVHGPEDVNGRAALSMTLVPREAAGYRSMRVWIDGEDALVRRFEIAEHNGSTRAFVLSSLQTNPQLADSLFAFEPPAGVRIVQPPGSD